MHRRSEVQRSGRRMVTGVLLAVIVAIAAAARFWALGFGLPHTNARPDETIIIDVALAFLHVRDSHFATTDVAMTFLLTLSVSFLLDAHLSKRRRDFIVAGILGGLAAATKYNAVL